MYPDKQQLLDSIQPGMKLTKAFFMKVYGYEISFPGFADEAIKALEDAGCSKAKGYYDNFVAEYQRERDKELKPVAAQVRKQWEADWKRLKKGSDERRIREIQGLTREELTELCQKLLQKGIIETPEQFATAVLSGQ